VQAAVKISEATTGSTSKWFLPLIIKRFYENT